MREFEQVKGGAVVYYNKELVLARDTIVTGMSSQGVLRWYHDSGGILL